MMHPLVQTTAAATLLPLRAALGDPGDATPPITALRTAATTLDDAVDTERRARTVMLAHWSSQAADNAGHNAGNITTTAENLSAIATQMAGNLTDAVHAAETARTRMNTIIDNYYTMGASLQSQLNTAAGVDALMKALRQHLADAQNLLDAHQANLRQLAGDIGAHIGEFASASATTEHSDHKGDENNTGKGDGQSAGHHKPGERKDHHSDHHPAPTPPESSITPTPAQTPPHAAAPPPTGVGVTRAAATSPMGPAGMPMPASGVAPGIPAMPPGYAAMPGWETAMMGASPMSYGPALGAEQLLSHMMDSGVGVANTGSGLIGHLADTATRSNPGATASNPIGNGDRPADHNSHDDVIGADIKDAGKAIHDATDPIIGSITHPHPIHPNPSGHTPPPHLGHHNGHTTTSPTHSHDNHATTPPTTATTGPTIGPTPSPTDAPSPSAAPTQASPSSGAAPVAQPRITPTDTSVSHHPSPTLIPGGQPGVTGPVARPESESGL